jgi:hypothetical protein
LGQHLSHGNFATTKQRCSWVVIVEGEKGRIRLPYCRLAGTKVKFLVGIFAAGDVKAGIVYADYDADAIEGIPQSTNVVAKK